MNKSKSTASMWFASLALICALLTAPVAYADTDGTELLVTDEPAQLHIQLGAEWVGAVFEMKTDAGVYPQPIVVGPDGTLSTELGGSKTYMLSVLQSSLRTKQPDAGEEHPMYDLTSTIPSQSGTPEESASTSEANQDDAKMPSELPAADASHFEGIPTTHLILFAGGLFVCAVVLFVMYLLKRRKESDADDDDYYEE